MKKYENPMLQVVSISANDVIATSLMRGDNLTSGTYEAGAPGQRGLNDWDAGY